MTSCVLNGSVAKYYLGGSNTPFPIPQLNFKIPRLIPRQSKCPRPMKMFGKWGMGNGKRDLTHSKLTTPNRHQIVDDTCYACSSSHYVTMILIHFHMKCKLHRNRILFLTHNTQLHIPHEICTFTRNKSLFVILFPFCTIEM